MFTVITGFIIGVLLGIIIVILFEDPSICCAFMLAGGVIGLLIAMLIPMETQSKTTNYNLIPLSSLSLSTDANKYIICNKTENGQLIYDFYIQKNNLPEKITVENPTFKINKDKSIHKYNETIDKNNMWSWGLRPTTSNEYKLIIPEKAIYYTFAEEE